MAVTRRETFQLFGGALAGTIAGGQPTTSYAQARPVVVALEDIPRRLDPLRVQLNPGYRVMYNMYDTLIAVDYKAGGKLVPGLATSWRRIDPKTIEVTLRNGVVFHDGSPMTADDVVFTFSEERISKKDSPGYPTAQQFLSTIEKAEAVNANTIRVTTKVPDPVLELRLSAWGSQIISKSAFERAGGWEGFSQKPIGTGPFSLERMTPDEIRLTAFPKYWGGAPTISTLVYRTAVELSARIAGLVTGDFDLISDVPPDQFTAVSRSKDLEIVGGSIASMRVVKFDTRNPDLKDVRVRQALALAVNYRRSRSRSGTGCWMSRTATSCNPLVLFMIPIAQSPLTIRRRQKNCWRQPATKDGQFPIAFARTPTPPRSRPRRSSCPCGRRWA